MPENGPAVVEEEGDVAGDGSQEGDGQADPGSSLSHEPTPVVRGQEAFRDPGEGEEEERAHHLIGGDLVRLAVEPLHHRSDQTIEGIVEDGTDRGQGEVDQHPQEGPDHEEQDGRRGIGRSHLVVPEMEGAQEVIVLLDAAGGGGDLVRMAPAQVQVALEEGLAEGETLREPPTARQLGRAAAVEVRRPRDQAGVLPGVVVEGDVLQAVVHAVGQVADGPLGIGLRLRDLGGGVDRLPHLDQGAGAEGLPGVEEEADGDDPGAQAGVLLLGFQDDPRRSGLEGQEGGLVVAPSLGKEGEDAAGA